MSRHRFHGDPTRFEVVAEFVATHFPHAKHVADVAGGQGMLTRILRKRYGVQAEVIDPRGWTLKGIPARAEEYSVSMADYYDVIVGLHPDDALREVVDSASIRETLVIPCCNFWTRDTRLGRDALLGEISAYQRGRRGAVEPVELAFRGPKNRGLILLPPPGQSRHG